jgi:hypothetical protein
MLQEFELIMGYAAVIGGLVLFVFCFMSGKL